MTEREKIELQRASFVLGAAPWIGETEAHARAEAAYPLPKRPREIEVKDGARYRIVNGRVELKVPHGLWRPSYYTLENLRAFGELAANPTEDDV